jgi:hypothetical protein
VVYKIYKMEKSRILKTKSKNMRRLSILYTLMGANIFLIVAPWAVYKMENFSI